MPSHVAPHNRPSKASKKVQLTSWVNPSPCSILSSDDDVSPHNDLEALTNMMMMIMTTMMHGPIMVPLDSSNDDDVGHVGHFSSSK